ncbi:MAG: LptA/OstA family protein [Bdellovibrionales bacterium]
MRRRFVLSIQSLSGGLRAGCGALALASVLASAFPGGAVAKATKAESYAKHSPSSATAPLESSGAFSGQTPVEVTADNSLEWHQAQRLYVARGNARATQGELTVEADTLTAHQRENAAQESAPNGNGLAAGGGSIDKLTADGHVRLTRGAQRISGEHAVYDLDARVAIVTGKHLRYENGDQIVTARDSLEYYEDRKIAVARGRAVAIQKDNKIEADTLSAEFVSAGTAAAAQSEGKVGGDHQLSKMTAIGNVAVFAGRDVARSDKAVYNADSKVAVLNGHVRITRGDGTQLSGDVGEVDFASGQSRLLNAGQGGRVRALLSTHAGGGKTGTPSR